MLYGILIANAAVAKLYSLEGKTHPLQLQREFEDRAGRAREQELLSDAAGRYSRGGKGGILSAMEHKMSPHRVEEHRFAKQLAGLLEGAVQRNEYEWLAIFAPPQFLGILRETLSPNVHKRLATSVPKDLIEVPTHDLPKHLTVLYPSPIENPAP